MTRRQDDDADEESLGSAVGVLDRLLGAMSNGTYGATIIRRAGEWQ